ncbi:MAG TPA: type II toxin-antitoxin system RelE/ParE family toxin [Cyclobacteriaceae bacterium]|nr:type II toxin-antitoxin system RelE/ParE family toxin [Cyclobacteriaceae bacterium]
MQVIWSDDAIADYHQNIDYLQKEWSSQVAVEFIEDVEAVIELITSHPELYPQIDYQEIRKAVVRKQITLLFKVKNKQIHLIRFWNNYQNPEKLKL